jgi:uncharacterized protein
VNRIHQTTLDDRAVSGGRQITFSFRTGVTPIPAVLLVPDSAARAPTALLLHGYSSRKEHMSDQVGQSLLRYGIASLAIDLPLHGTRADPKQAGAGQLGMMELMRHWGEARAEAQLALTYIRAHPRLDEHRTGIVGYSLGSLLSLVTAADDPNVRAVVLAAGGDLPAQLPFAALVRTAIDPLRSVRRFAGRPLLMVHGRYDPTVRPDQAERLYNAAAEPKTLRWYESGHRLPQAAIDAAAEWLAEQLHPANVR